MISLLFKRICKADQYYSPQTLNGTQNTPPRTKQEKNPTPTKSKTYTPKAADNLEAKSASHLNEFAHV